MTQPEHLQDRQEAWESSSDEAHIQALYQPAPFPDPAYMGYLKRERPQVITNIDISINFFELKH